MANEPNTPDHRWYERRNNIALSNEDLSRETIFDSGIQEINSWINSQPWGFDYPQLVLDFDDEYYRVDGGDTTFSSAITHTRASTATYVDSTGTLQTAAINEPRLGHHVWNGTAWVNEGLLHESEARTNASIDSQALDTWTTNGSVTVTASAHTGPDGNLSLTEIATSVTNDGIYDLSGVNATVGQPICFSVFAKGVSGAQTIRVTLEGSTAFGGAPQGYIFDLTDGSVSSTLGSPNAFFVEDFGGGLYRLSIVATPVASAAFNHVIYSGSSIANTFAVGFTQLELNAPTPSSYIPTAGSTVTRSADVLTIPAANLPYNSTALSIQMDGRITYADRDISNEAVFYNWVADGNNRIVAQLNSGSGTGSAFFIQVDGGVFDFVISPSVYAPEVLVPFNISSRHGSNFLSGAVDGVALTANTTPTSLPDLSASNLLLASTYNGTIRTFRMWGQDIGDTGLVEATT